MHLDLSPCTTSQLERCSIKCKLTVSDARTGKQSNKTNAGKKARNNEGRGKGKSSKQAKKRKE